MPGARAARTVVRRAGAESGAALCLSFPGKGTTEHLVLAWLSLASLTIFNCGGYVWCGWRFARCRSVVRHPDGGGLGAGGQGGVDDLG
jgi:hypothetical protein